VVENGAEEVLVEFLETCMDEESVEINALDPIRAPNYSASIRESPSSVHLAASAFRDVGSPSGRVSEAFHGRGARRLDRAEHVASRASRGPWGAKLSWYMSKSLGVGGENEWLT
jgi:hypothetical protein